MDSENQKVTTPKRIAVVGSTGSIGTQALDIISEYPQMFTAQVLVAGRNADLLIQQCLNYRPTLAVIADDSLYGKVRTALAGTGIEVAAGNAAVCDAVARTDVDIVLTATVGYSGLAPTLRAIDAGKDIALANKETLVVAGELVKRRLAKSTSRIMPVDSEHSAIYQCLIGEDPTTIEKLIITASGGPFRQWSKSQLERATVADALAHPNWDMGAKITIDSATMMNKAFEIIEARWLFDIAPEKIEAVVHPQSIIHSMVQFNDGAVKAQLGLPDMHLPIRYALGQTKRLSTTDAPLTLSDYANLTFERPNMERFPCLGFAHRALAEGGTTACVINAANEVAVAAFLKGKIRFVDIHPLIEDTLHRMLYVATPEYDDYVQTNTLARTYASEIVENNKK